MTEAEWLTASDPRRMFVWLRQIGRADRYQLGRLFVACCDLIPPSIAESTGQGRPGDQWADDEYDQNALTNAGFYLSGAVLEAMHSITRGKGTQTALAGAIRDIFGNPFRPRVEFTAEWRTDAVVSLARQMREGRGFGTMPILANALRDAGCEDVQLLGHCHSSGPHVRGCWVVDLILGKG